jgi:hypothetical protein
LRPQVSQFGEIYNDFKHFTSTVAEKTRVTTLLEELSNSSSTHSTNSSMIFVQEALWQDKTNHFLSNLLTKYPHYSDVLQPVMTAIHQIKYGLRLAALATNDDIRTTGFKVSLLFLQSNTNRI